MKELLTTLSIPLSWLALPTLLIWAYDKWVAAPNRPRDEKGEPAPGPLYARIAEWLLPFVLVAVVLRIGVSVVFGWAKEFAVPLSLVALPVGLWCAIDSWLLAPRRQIAAGSAAIKDPPLVRAAYTLLPVLVVAIIVRLISAETLDFSLVLLVLSLATGAVWLIDHLVFRKQREAAMLKGVGGQVTLPEPGTVDYARSFFPVAFIVLIVRAFIFEPFRIPSDSMMPTLLDGDFIVVNKFAYGLRWPVINEKFIDLGSPQRGDVVVFRHPPHPEVNFIKRLVGLPGDHVEIHDDHLVINGETIPLEDKGRYTDGCYVGLRLSTETIGAHTHQVMSCRTSQSFSSAPGTGSESEPGLPACDRMGFNEKYGRLRCVETPPNAGPDANDHVFDFDVVPAGFYLMIGDNRDNSDDSRGWGLVPDKNLVGKATRIWFNFDLQRSGVVNWSRIGKSID
jgi:signal peptidase I